MGLGCDYTELTVHLNFSPPIDGLNGERIIIATLEAMREHLGRYGDCTATVQRGSVYHGRLKNSETTSCESPSSAPEISR